MLNGLEMRGCKVHGKPGMNPVVCHLGCPAVPEPDVGTFQVYCMLELYLGPESRVQASLLVA